MSDFPQESFAYWAASVTHGVGIVMLAELTAPLSSASRLAAFSECATPRSAVCRIAAWRDAVPAALEAVEREPHGSEWRHPLPT